jgi:hypothetical protein
MTAAGFELSGGLGFCAEHDAAVAYLANRRRHIAKIASTSNRDGWYYLCEAGPGPGERAILERYGPGPFVKIGSSINVRARMHSLGAKLLLAEPGGQPYEATLQIHFWDLWVVGEWYRPGDQLLAFIEHGQARLQEAPVVLRPRDGKVHIKRGRWKHNLNKTHCGLELAASNRISDMDRRDAPFRDATCKRCREAYRAAPEHARTPLPRVGVTRRSRSRRRPFQDAPPVRQLFGQPPTASS